MNESRAIAANWMRIAFFNLLIVAFLGLLMRYKITFSFPLLQQKNVLHAHSHFAFTGWITQALLALMVYYLTGKDGDAFKKHKPWLWTNLIASYGILLSFPFVGYHPISIAFSTLSIFVSYGFAYSFWRHLNKSRDKSLSSYWFKAALIFNVISSFGTFSLAYMMANKLGHTQWYLSSIYYFLHFQYNGWFFFACMGLISPYLSSLQVSEGLQRRAFWLFTIACVPAYFLSALWLKIPAWTYILVVGSAIAQVVAWMLLAKGILKNRAFQWSNRMAKLILSLAAIALSIKLLLQLGSTIPTLSHIAFGFRPIVIGYLHLVLLGVVSFFLIGYVKLTGLQADSNPSRSGIIIFVAGVVLNEVVLMVQGIGAMSYTMVPYTSELLLGIAVIMFAGILIINISRDSSCTRVIENCS